MHWIKEDTGLFAATIELAKDNGWDILFHPADEQKKRTTSDSLPKNPITFQKRGEGEDVYTLTDQLHKGVWCVFSSLDTRGSFRLIESFGDDLPHTLRFALINYKIPA